MTPLVGVLDSGVGGLTVLSALTERLPQVSFLYVGDTARNPYGGETPARITAMARECMRYLCDAGATVLVVACNTITFTALPALAREFDVPCIGMPSDVPAWKTAKHAAIVATPATIATHVHRDALRRHYPQVQVTETAVDGLAAAIEGGDRMRAQALITAAVRPWQGVDTALWACTHYPLAADIWRGVCPQVRWVNPAAQVAEETARILGDMPTGTGGVRLCFTDARAAAGLAQTAYADTPWEVVDISQKRGGR